MAFSFCWLLLQMIGSLLGFCDSLFNPQAQMVLPKFQFVSGQIQNLKYFIFEVEPEVKTVPAVFFLSFLDGRHPEDQGSERRRGGHQGRGHGPVPGHGWDGTPLRLGESYNQSLLQLSNTLGSFHNCTTLENYSRKGCPEQSFVTARSQTMGE